MAKFDFEPIDIDIIDVDLDCAKYLFYKTSNSDTPVKMNPKTMNLCVYHSAQVIEKSLKYIYYKDTGKQDITHNISELLVDVEMNRKGFIGEHRSISENAHYITGLNNARYGGTISKDTAYKMLNIAKDIYKELCAEFGKPQYEMYVPPKAHKGKPQGKSEKSANKQDQPLGKD